jgi:hypothetical protein
LKEQHPEKGLWQVATNTGADSYTAIKKKGLRQFQMETCQPIKRLKDKKKRKNDFKDSCCVLHWCRVKVKQSHYRP